MEDFNKYCCWLSWQQLILTLQQARTGLTEAEIVASWQEQTPAAIMLNCAKLNQQLQNILELSHNLTEQLAARADAIIIADYEKVQLCLNRLLNDLKARGQINLIYQENAGLTLQLNQRLTKIVTHLAATINSYFNQKLIDLCRQGISQQSNAILQLHGLLSRAPVELQPQWVSSTNHEQLDQVLTQIVPSACLSNSLIQDADIALLENYLKLAYIRQQLQNAPHQVLERIDYALILALRLNKISDSLVRQRPYYAHLLTVTQDYRAPVIQYVYLLGLLQNSEQELRKVVGGLVDDLNSLLTDLQQARHDDLLSNTYYTTTTRVIKEIKNILEQVQSRLLVNDYALTKLYQGEEWHNFAAHLHSLVSLGQSLSGVAHTLYYAEHQLKQIASSVKASGGIQFSVKASLNDYLNGLLSSHLETYFLKYIAIYTKASVFAEVASQYKHELGQQVANIELASIYSESIDSLLIDQARVNFLHELEHKWQRLQTNFAQLSLNAETYVYSQEMAELNHYAHIMPKQLLVNKLVIDDHDYHLAQELASLANQYQQDLAGQTIVKTCQDLMELNTYLLNVDVWLQEPIKQRQIGNSSVFNACLYFLGSYDVRQLLNTVGLSHTTLSSCLVFARAFETIYLQHFKCRKQKTIMDVCTNRLLGKLLKRQLHPRRFDAYWLLAFKIINQLLLIVAEAVATDGQARQLDAVVRLERFDQSYNPLNNKFSQKFLQNINQFEQLKLTSGEELNPELKEYSAVRALENIAGSPQHKLITVIDQVFTPELNFSKIYNDRCRWLLNDKGASGRSMAIIKMANESVFYVNRVLAVNRLIKLYLYRRMLASHQQGARDE